MLSPDENDSHRVVDGELTCYKKSPGPVFKNFCTDFSIQISIKIDPGTCEKSSGYLCKNLSGDLDISVEEATHKVSHATQNVSGYVCHDIGCCHVYSNVKRLANECSRASVVAMSITSSRAAIGCEDTITGIATKLVRHIGSFCLVNERIAYYMYLVVSIAL
jgi:hypothetical protein